MTQIPVPTPDAGEAQNDFVSRCISSLHSTDPERSDDQITAMCFSQWRNREGAGTIHPHFRTILKLFIKRDGKEAGLKRFWNFIYNNALSIFKPYDPAIQFTEGIQLREAFDWLRPHIEFFRKDKDAKYYKIECIHAITSMNDRSYEDTEQMKFAGPTMNFRPVNINHDHSRWQPFPRTRLDYSKTEDNTVEGILRVDNRERRLQQQLDHDPSIPEKEWIYHPSIEGRPNLGGMKEDGYHFTGISLLEKGYQLPGDPLTEISPLLMEAVTSGETCLLIDGEQLCLPCTEDQGGINMTENVEVSEAEGPINPEGALCPQCGHKITPDPTIEANEIECPRCDTPMVRLPEKAVEAMKELSEEDSLQYARDNLAELSELFRPPFPFTPNRKFNKTTGVDLKKVVLPSVDGAVDGATIGIVEHQEAIAQRDKKIAELTAQLVTGEAQMRTLKSKISEMSLELDTLRESLSDTKRVAGGAEGLKVQVGGLTEKIVTLQNDLSTEKGRITELEAVIDSKITRTNILLEEVKGLKETIGNLKEQLNTIRVERNDLSVKAKSSEEKALNETRERSRIQNEEADYLDKIRKLTGEVSKLSERIAKEAKTRLDQETEIAGLKEQMIAKEAEYKAKLTELTETINQAKKFHKWAWDHLKKAGYAATEK